MRNRNKLLNIRSNDPTHVDWMFTGQHLYWEHWIIVCDTEFPGSESSIPLRKTQSIFSCLYRVLILAPAWATQKSITFWSVWLTLCDTTVPFWQTTFLTCSWLDLKRKEQGITLICCKNILLYRHFRSLSSLSMNICTILWLISPFAPKVQ